MLNAASLAAVDAAGWRGPFIRPLNASYSFGNLPHAIQHLLTGEGDLGLPADCFAGQPTRADAVILLFIDGFGWRFLEPRLAHYPALQRLAQSGVVSKLTSLFPSTTSAHVTCIHTGLPPAQSGVYEWFQYEPSLDRMIGTLMFNLAVRRNATRC
jgi:predicted AlkP superfamily pyrophosphatase or phosphodiesterase